VTAKGKAFTAENAELAEIFPFLAFFGVLGGEWALLRELILQGYNRLAVAAEGGDFLQIAVGLGQGHHWPVAVDGVAAGGKVPASAFGVVLDLSSGTADGLRWFGSRQTEQQG
jgi:hypothetical protein